LRQGELKSAFFRHCDPTCGASPIEREAGLPIRGDGEDRDPDPGPAKRDGSDGAKESFLIPHLDETLHLQTPIILGLSLRRE
jgi:hypothetical protein